MCTTSSGSSPNPLASAIFGAAFNMARANHPNNPNGIGNKGGIFSHGGAGGQFGRSPSFPGGAGPAPTATMARAPGLGG